MAIRLHKLAVALGVFIVSAPAFSHGHHSHGKPLTEVEQKAANGCLLYTSDAADDLQPV